MFRALFVGLAMARLASAAMAQNAPHLGTVIDTEVIVRAGPSDKFKDTGTLKKGARVVVDHEEFGWLAIQAPRGSVSWVPIAFVDFDTTRPVPQNVMVSEDVVLASGKVGLAEPQTDIRRTKVPAGSILTVVGQRVTFDNKQWYPVEPIEGDFRYVPKSSVQAGEPANTAFVVRDTAPPGLAPAGATIPATPTGTSGGKPVVDDPLWLQAEAAERDGRTDDAEKLYFQLARKMNEPGGDHDIANLCYTRIHAIREKKRSSMAPTSSGPTAVRTDSPRGDRPALLPPVKNDSPLAVSTQPNPSKSSGDKGNWTGVGRLLISPLALDGRQTYALESGPGMVQMYVVAGTGVNLEQYKKKYVKVYGNTYTHPNAAKPYIVATEVAEANP
jgi:hypothetical protein